MARLPNHSGALLVKDLAAKKCIEVKGTPARECQSNLGRSEVAEAVRFELTNPLRDRQFSRLVPSTTRPRFQSRYSKRRVTRFTACRQAPRRLAHTALQRARGGP